MRGYIGIKQADGTILPLLYTGQVGRVNIQCAPSWNKQKEAHIQFYFVHPREGTRKIHTLVIKRLKQKTVNIPFLSITLSQKKESTNARLLVTVPGQKEEHDLELNGGTRGGGFHPGGSYREEVILKRSPVLKNLLFGLYGLLLAGMIYFLIRQLPPSL